jgi:predicted membrane protein
VLSFIGVKMLLPLIAEGLIMVMGHSEAGFTGFLERYLHHDYEQAVINISLSIVIGTIILAIVLSLIFPPKTETAPEAAAE